MKYACFLSVLPILLSSALCADDTGEGWTSLFDGKSLAGWTVRAAPADREVSFWKVADGAIECNSLGHRKHNYVWLLSDREYGNFQLRLEFQVFKSSPGNSGIQFRSRIVDDIMNGPQVDIHPPTPLRTGLIYDETKGVNRWIHPSLPNWNITADKAPEAARATVLNYADNDPSAWNTLELTADGMNVTTRVNGRPVADFNGSGILDDAKHANARVGVTGHLALQLHSHDELRIRFRNIRIRTLNEKE
jgi:hypothetical protein